MDFGITNADCLEGMKSLPDESVHLVATDPPYGVGYVSNRRKKVQVPGGVVDASENTDDVVRAVENDAKWDPDWFEEVVRSCHRILAQDTHVYIFGSDHVIAEQKKIIQAHFTFKNLIVWDKGVHTAGDLDGAYGKQTEFIIFAQKGRRPLKGGRPANLISVDKVPPDRLLHSCQKPVALMSFLIEHSTDPGEIVCDPFAGSGSTMLAATGLGRKFVGWEIDPRTYQIAVKRLFDDQIQMKLF